MRTERFVGAADRAQAVQRSGGCAELGIVRKAAVGGKREFPVDRSAAQAETGGGGDDRDLERQQPEQPQADIEHRGERGGGSTEESRAGKGWCSTCRSGK